ncbi:MAG: hypothetical protein Fur0034_07960 [Desulfuromonadia bacterium]
MSTSDFVTGARRPVIRTRFGWIPREFIMDERPGAALKEAQERRADRGRRARTGWGILVALAVCVPAAGGYFYSRLKARASHAPIAGMGAVLTPAQAPAPVASAAALPVPAQAAPDARTDLEPLVARLAARLERQPDDGAGWVLLARSHNELGRFPQAAAAYAKALTLVKKDPEVWAEYADVLVRVAGERWNAHARAALASALELDAFHPAALWLAGVEAMERGDSRAALQHWERLATLADADSELGRKAAAGIAWASSEKVAAPVRSGERR